MYITLLIAIQDIDGSEEFIKNGNSLTFPIRYHDKAIRIKHTIEPVCFNPDCNYSREAKEQEE